MRASNFFIPTLREVPNDAELISHRLMLRSGMIRQLASGVYSYLPLGWKVIRKIENIVREEMDAIDAQEMMMPALQPAKIWKESGRWQDYGPELFRLGDRHNRDFCLGPTHEEVITSLLRNEANSYKQLPLCFYQIQTKFRDEIRPRFGVMRGREFIMKDAYSFHLTAESLKQTYDDMYKAYCNIFDRIGLTYKVVEADSGSIGGHTSSEFHVLADSGEDAIAYSKNYAANVELAVCAPPPPRPVATQAIELIDTPNVKSIDDLSKQHGIAAHKSLKTLVVHAADYSADNPQLIALILRGDHRLNAIKAQNHQLVKEPLCFASKEEIKQVIGCSVGSLGPVKLPIPYIVDGFASVVADFGCGANQEGKHYVGANWLRDCPLEYVEDIREVQEGDISISGEDPIKICRGIEVGHIFQLGTKYSDAMGYQITNEDGKNISPSMGCYGIGITRIAAAFIEQNNDEKGIVWSKAITPFDLAIVVLGYAKSAAVKMLCDEVYAKSLEQKIDVLLDDRDMRLGGKLSDVELLGIPWYLIISERGIKQQRLELKTRGGKCFDINVKSDIVGQIITILEGVSDS